MWTGVRSWRASQQVVWPDWSFAGNMLEFFGGNGPYSMPALHQRKLRLFIFACCRAINCHSVTPDRYGSPGTLEAAEATADVTATPLSDSEAMSAANFFVAGSPVSNRVLMADILREILGNPFRENVWSLCTNCSGQGWKTKTDHDNDSALRRPCRRCGPPAHAVSLAEGAYLHRLENGLLDPVRLAILADALEEADLPDHICPRCQGRGTVWNGGHPGAVGYQSGMVPCDRSADDPRPCEGRRPHLILEHLRSPGDHFLGCWAVDSILGKELFA